MTEKELIVKFENLTKQRDFTKGLIKANEHIKKGVVVNQKDIDELIKYDINQMLDWSNLKPIKDIDEVDVLSVGNTFMFDHENAWGRSDVPTTLLEIEPEEEDCFALECEINKKPFLIQVFEFKHNNETVKYITCQSWVKEIYNNYDNKINPENKNKAIVENWLSKPEQQKIYGKYIYNQDGNLTLLSKYKITPGMKLSDVIKPRQKTKIKTR